jgi:arylsulfatase A
MRRSYYFSLSSATINVLAIRSASETRPTLLCAFIFVTLCPLFVRAAEVTDKIRRPNIVFVLCDDLGYGDLACFANPIIKTPCLDQLAKDGMKLTQCYAAAPVCSPSRAGIMTGRNPNRCGIRDWIPPNTGIYLKRDEISVARLLKSAGYRTGHVGKWHLNSKMDGSEPTPGDHGFDHWFSTQNNAYPSHENPTNFVRNGKPVGPLTGNSSTLIMDEAIRFLRTAKEGPFMLFIWFHAPHEPVATPAEYTNMYSAIDDPTKRIYYGSVTLVDHEVGRLLKTLDEMKVRDKTFVMFTSDNGPETLRRYKGAERSHGSPGPLRGMKLHVHEGGYRVPGIIHWPGRTPRGVVCDEPVCGVDVLPTLCAMTGAKVPDDRPIDGANFLPILEGKPVVRKTPLYWQFDRAISKPWTVSLRQGPWKLLADPKLEKFSLYNLLEDVAEAKDWAGDQPGRVSQMAEAMRRLHREINAGMPAKP